MKKFAILSTALLLTGLGCGPYQITTMPPAAPAPVAENTPTTPPPTEQTEVVATPPDAATVMTAPTAPTGVVSKTGRAKIFFVAVDDNGKAGKMIGCGDSIVGVENIIDPPGADPLVATLTTLFQVNDDYYGESGLYNSLYDSRLQVKKITAANGLYTVELGGTMSLGGSCDEPRFYSQIMETIQQFGEIKKAEVFINNKKLEDLVSGRGN